MKEYRKEMEHRPDSEYAWVDLGPIPGLPDWHLQSEASTYPFPTNAAALRFAAAHRQPGRQVVVRMKEEVA